MKVALADTIWELIEESIPKKKRRDIAMDLVDVLGWEIDESEWPVGSSLYTAAGYFGTRGDRHG